MGSEPSQGASVGFDRLVADALATSFSGWDWSVFDGRLVETEPPWDLRSMIGQHLAVADALLDLGTGGGEFLSSLAPLPPDTAATEGYAPNLPLARDRLQPQGVQVVPVGDDDRLAFEDQRFDLVIDRHESFDAAEVARVLRPGGTFLTQQVGGRDLAELNELFGRPATYAGWGLEVARAQLEGEGLQVVTAQEALLPGAFHDVGAVVLFCRVTPWQVPGFSVTGDEPALRRIHDLIERDGALEVYAHRFVIEAHRPH